MLFEYGTVLDLEQYGRSSTRSGNMYLYMKMCSLLVGPSIQLCTVGTASTKCWSGYYSCVLVVVVPSGGPGQRLPWLVTALAGWLAGWLAICPRRAHGAARFGISQWLAM